MKKYKVVIKRASDNKIIFEKGFDSQEEATSFLNNINMADYIK